MSADLACIAHTQVQAAPVVCYQIDTSEYCQRTSLPESIANAIFAIITSVCVLISPTALDPLNYFGFYKVCHVCLLPHCDAFPCSEPCGANHAFMPIVVVQLGNASSANLLQGCNGVKRTGIMCPQ